MRPLKVEVEGFASFRERTVIDFEDADYFVLVGPTGSGKSSVVDAICFALYGSVPRLDGKAVAPVITQGQLQARVRLDFTLGGSTYSAVRVVRRQGPGATTKEARLESGGEVLAGNANELSQEVGRLIGLSFDDFTRCVALPQGEFARFLHDKARDRQGMIVALLGLEVYERMRKTAHERAATLKASIDINDGRLAEDFSSATTEVLEEAARRSAELNELSKRVRESVRTIDELGREIEAADAEVARVLEQAKRLGGLGAPDNMATLVELITSARTHSEKAARVHNEARADATQKERAHKSLGRRDPLAAAHKAHEDKAKVAGELERVEVELGPQRDAEEQAGKARQEAEQALEEARESVQAARDTHAALHLASSLKAGEDCPVCLQTVTALPPHLPSADLESAERTLAGSRKKATAVAETHDEARRELTRSEERFKSCARRLEELEAEVRDHPDAGAVAAALQTIDEAEEAWTTARELEKKAHDAREAAADALEAATNQEHAARRLFDEQREQIIELAPPPPRAVSLADDWAGLTEWARARMPQLQKVAESRRAAACRDAKQRKALLEAIAKEFQDLCIEEIKGDLTTTVAVALAQARSKEEQIADAIEEAKRLNHKVAQDREAHQVTHALEQHLRSNGFERWIVAEALERLVAGANEILADLSGGHYALKVDEGSDFLVIDRDNANETRSVRTLSGGETFLASLALALALADQLADLAAKGAARLDAIFLDEGFGTLDSETLDTVAASVENLASTGRMVGVITHVRELADRIPLQFRVRKDAGSSRIERVSA